MKKPFKDTKVGSFLNNALPGIADVLPDKGILGIAKNIIDKSTVSPEEKAEMLAEIQAFEKEMYELEIKDRDSARNREIEIIKAGGNDHLMYVSGYVALIAFMVMIFAVIFLPESVSHNSLFHQLMGIIEGVALTVFGYYFGTSKGSHDKNTLIKK
jgi:hypothetical protein